MARLRSAPAVPASQPESRSRRPALKEKTNTARAKAAFPDSDKTEGLIKESTKRRGRPRKSAHDSDELVMAGGLGQKEAEAPRSDLGATMTDELAKSDAPAPPTAKANKRPPRMTRKPIQNEAQSKVLDGLKKRMAETARREVGKKGATVAQKRVSIEAGPSSDVLTAAPVTVRKPVVPAQDLSEYDIEDSPPPTGKRSSLAKQSSSLKPRSTPAMDTSVLKNFKRRARQPSMLAMVQQRTMSARPSMANATVAQEDPSIYDFDAGEGEDEDDFAPEAEGTPQHMTKVKRKSEGSSSKKPVAKAAAKAKSAPASKKRKSAEADVSSGSLEGLRAKRRKSMTVEQPPEPAEDDIIVPESQPVERRSSTETARHPTPIPLETSGIQVVNSSQSTPPPAEPASPELRGETPVADFAVPSTEEYNDEVQPDLDDDLPDDPLQGAPNGTMAEPASSSPISDDFPSGTQADPVTQLSPQPIKAAPKKAAKAKPISTATLQNLLPKRRQPLKPRHRKSEYDFDVESDGEGELDTGHLDEDEDELGGRRRRQTKVTPAKSRRKTAAAGKSTKSKAAQNARKSSAVPQANKAVKTYGRAAAVTIASDKENEDDPGVLEEEDDSTDVLPEKTGAKAAARSNEIEEARRKFAEVDEWDMEFESLGDEEHRSSSQQWR